MSQWKIMLQIVLLFFLSFKALIVCSFVFTSEIRISNVTSQQQEKWIICSDHKYKNAHIMTIPTHKSNNCLNRLLKSNICLYQHTKMLTFWLYQSTHFKSILIWPVLPKRNQKIMKPKRKGDRQCNNKEPRRERNGKWMKESQDGFTDRKDGSWRQKVDARHNWALHGHHDPVMAARTENMFYEPIIRWVIGRR